MKKLVAKFRVWCLPQFLEEKTLEDLESPQDLEFLFTSDTPKQIIRHQPRAGTSIQLEDLQRPGITRTETSSNMPTKLFLANYVIEQDDHRSTLPSSFFQ